MPTMKSKLAELKSYIRNAPPGNKDNINYTITLYQNRAIFNFKTALNTVKALASNHQAVINSNKVNKKYTAVTQAVRPIQPAQPLPPPPPPPPPPNN